MGLKFLFHAYWWTVFRWSKDDYFIPIKMDGRLSWMISINDIKFGKCHRSWPHTSAWKFLCWMHYFMWLSYDACPGNEIHLHSIIYQFKLFGLSLIKSCLYCNPAELKQRAKESPPSVYSHSKQDRIIRLSGNFVEECHIVLHSGLCPFRVILYSPWYLIMKCRYLMWRKKLYICISLLQ